MTTSKKEYLITVTRRDIDLGEQSSPSACPVARAAKRVFKRQVGVADNLRVVYQRLPWGDRQRTFSLPQRAVNFIHKFDELPDEQSRAKLKPFSFKVRAAA